MTPEFHRDALLACHACATACEQSANEGLEEMDVHLMTRCIELTRSCADICSLTAREFGRNSPVVERVAQLCAEVCDDCAAECVKYELEHCQHAGEACRRCAEACRELTVAIARS